MEPRLTVFCDLWFDGHEVRSGETQIGIEGDRVRSISPASRCSSTRTGVIDARGTLLAPGLINAHTHTARGGMFSPDEAISIDTIVRNFRDILRAGVTTVGEMGNAAGLTYSLREFFKKSPECGPDIFGCGPLITAPGGYPLDWMPAVVAMLGVAIPCVSAEDGRRAVRSVIASGMDGVKLSIMHKSYGDKPIPAIGKDAALAVVEEAHAQGRRVFCHAHYYEDYDLALEVGVDAIMHSCFDPLDEAMVERVRASGVFYGPTLCVFENALKGIEERWDRDPRYTGLVSARVARDWTEFCEEFLAAGDVVPSGIAAGLPMERGPEALANTADNFRKLTDVGVPVVYGTDASYGFCLLGRPVDEFSAMQRAGFSPVDCLRSATSTAAEMLGLAGRGVIEEGARADIVILDPGVVDDVGKIDKVYGVVRAGKLLDDTPVKSAARAARTAAAVSRGMVRTAGAALKNNLLKK